MQYRVKMKWQYVSILAALLVFAGCDILEIGPSRPEKPRGPSSLNVNEQGTFYSFVSSGDVDSVSLKFDFGGGHETEWSEFVPVGDTVYATHAWQESGTYYVRAQAKDRDGNTSEWSDALTVSVGSQSSDSFALSEAGSFGKGGNVAISGNLLFVASKNNGLYIVDITNPANPVELSNYVPPNTDKGPYVTDVKVNGNYAYITITYLLSSNTELEVLDIQNPSSPVSVGVYVDTSGHADFEKLYYDNGKCYVVGQYNTFRIIDVSNPQVPNVMGGVVLNNSVGSDIYVENGYAYVATREMGIQIIDVSNPQNPG